MRQSRLVIAIVVLAGCGQTEADGGSPDAASGTAGTTGGSAGSSAGSGGTSAGGAGGSAGTGGTAAVSGDGGSANAPSLPLLPACIEYRNSTDSLDAQCTECVAGAQVGPCSSAFNFFFASEACKVASQCLNGCLFCQQAPCGSGTCTCEAACAGCGPPECTEALREWYLCATEECSPSCRDCKQFGALCSENKDCCSVRCVAGTCAEGLAAPCLDAGASCSLGDQCCSRTCINDTCTPLPCDGGN